MLLNYWLIRLLHLSIVSQTVPTIRGLGLSMHLEKGALLLGQGSSLFIPLPLTHSVPLLYSFFGCFPDEQSEPALGKEGEAKVKDGHVHSDFAALGGIQQGRSQEMTVTAQWPSFPIGDDAEILHRNTQTCNCGQK